MSLNDIVYWMSGENYSCKKWYNRVKYVFDNKQNGFKYKKDVILECQKRWPKDINPNTIYNSPGGIKVAILKLENERHVIRCLKKIKYKSGLSRVEYRYISSQFV